MSSTFLTRKVNVVGQVAIRQDDGRLTGARGLTEQQLIVLRAYAASGDLTLTAKETGIPYQSVTATMRLAHVQAALLGECRHVLARAAPEMIEIITAIARNKDHPVRVRLDAGKTVLDRVGLAPVRAGEAGQGDKRDLADLSPAELRAFIDQGQDAIAKREAVTVDCAPVPDQDAS